MRLERVLTVLGRTFIGAGVLVFLFIAYQLWGTNFSESRNQDRLKDDVADLFAAAAEESPTVTTATPGKPAPPNTTPAPPPAPAGSAVAVIKIPKLGVEKAVVSGTDVNDLKKGPGHYLNTPLPGQPGNAAIAGHRTTYGAPFGAINELVKGDPIQVATRQGRFTYRVTETKIVDPSDVSVLRTTKDNRLTLTTCHPRFSAAKRLIVVAVLDTSPAPAAPTTATPPTTAPTNNGKNKASTTTTANTVVDVAALSGADLSGTPTDKFPALMWALITIAVALITWVVSQIKGRLLAYLIGTPIFFVCLFIFFENFSRLLPANA